MGLCKTIFHLGKSLRPKHLWVITISQFHDPSISPCCQFFDINAAAVASHLSVVTRSLKKHKSSAAAVIPADIADRAGNASPSVVTMSLKMPKPSATVVVWAWRYLSRGNAGRKTSIAVGASTDSVVKNDTNTKLSAKQKDAIADKHDEL
jgi:hypothetical protein